MSKPTIEEMREQLVNNVVQDIRDMVIHDRGKELFDFVYGGEFKNTNDYDIETLYMDLYGDELELEEKKND